MDQVLYDKACKKIIHKEKMIKGIGTLGEKTVHAVMKYYFEPDERLHEKKIEGYYADIITEEGIIEIQTRNFSALRKKLNVFLKLGKVTIIYPIPYIKWIRWMNMETGEISKSRKSPKKGTFSLAFIELYKIKEFLNDSNIRFHFILLNMEEYRMLNGWSRDKKKGSTRYDRIPLELINEIDIEKKEDYKKLIPFGAEEEFTSADYSKMAQVSISIAQKALIVLSYVGAIKKVGKKGRFYRYRIEDSRTVD